jgi:hypothetical protein
MTNRTDRDLLISLLNQYISEEITAFELDEYLTELSYNTNDKTVKIVSNFMWHFYDDVKDHTIVASKEEWDLFQRLVLLLESDEELIEMISKKYTIRQMLSLGLLCIFFYAWWKFGYNLKLLITSMLLGGFSIIISAWKEKEEQGKDDIIREIFPFENLHHLMKTRKKITGFKKKKYNRRLRRKSIRNPSMDMFMHLINMLAWLVYSPIVLLFQSMPEKETRVKTKT